MTLFRSLKNGITEPFQQVTPLIAAFVQTTQEVGTWLCYIVRWLKFSVGPPPSRLGALLPRVSCCNSQCFFFVCLPESPLYGAVNRFLLQRPFLDLTDVPMFYSCFNASSQPHWRKHRTWLLQLLLSGVRSASDFLLLQRRHAVPMLLTFHDGGLSDYTSRQTVLQV